MHARSLNLTLEELCAQHLDRDKPMQMQQRPMLRRHNANYGQGYASLHRGVEMTPLAMVLQS